MTYATLAQKFLTARAIYNTTTKVAEAEYEAIYDLELSEDEEDAQCSVISKRHGLQAMLNGLNSAQAMMLNGLKSFLDENDCGEMFVELRRIPVRCAEIMIRG
jgi:hypothetical protein